MTSSHPSVTRLSEQELDELEQFLDSDAAPTEAMDLSMVHGFLTALALTPGGAPSAETWLAHIWGDEGEVPEFSSPEQRSRIEGLFERLYQQLRIEVAEPEAPFTPLLYEDEDSNHDIARPWCFGFSQGVWLTEDSWEELLEEDDSAALLEPIFNCADEEARAQLEEEGQDLSEWEHAIAQALPDLVAELFASQRTQH